jgi:hypothetical protein
MGGVDAFFLTDDCHINSDPASGGQVEPSDLVGWCLRYINHSAVWQSDSIQISPNQRVCHSGFRSVRPVRGVKPDLGSLPH